jgi:hypothetical protein
VKETINALYNCSKSPVIIVFDCSNSGFLYWRGNNDSNLRIDLKKMKESDKNDPNFWWCVEGPYIINMGTVLVVSVKNNSNLIDCGHVVTNPK